MVARVTRQSVFPLTTNPTGAKARVAGQAITYMVKDTGFDLRWADEIQGVDELFLNIDFPRRIAYGSQGLSTFVTELTTVDSGSENRIGKWNSPRRAWNIAYAVTEYEDLMDLLNFFNVVKGRLHSFRFRDPMEYKSSAFVGRVHAAIDDEDQQIGTGDNTTTTFQLIKTYTVPHATGAGSETYVRNITAPVASTVLIALDSVPQTNPTHFTVDDTTGIVTFVTAPGTDVVITAGFEFDIPCRFDVDQLPLDLDSYGLGKASSINVIEIKQD